MNRRRTTLPAAALLSLLAGCGTSQASTTATQPTETSTETSTADAMTSAPIDPGPSTSATPVTPSAEPSAAVLPDDFPLDAGLPEANGDDGTPVRVTGRPTVADLNFCETPAWTATDPGVVDVAGASYTGEAEDLRSRTLALYATRGEAATAVDAVRRDVAACPAESYGGTDQVFEVISDETDDDGSSLVLTHRYRTDGRFDTGLEVLRLVQVGPALLVSVDYAEGGGSPETIASFVEVTDEAIRDVVAAQTAAFA